MKTCPRCHLEYHDDENTHCIIDGVALLEAEDPRIGRLLLGHYLVEGKLGAGGMATVYRAHETSSGRAVAVKVMHAHLCSDPDLRERFRREAKNASALTHENIVEVYEAGETLEGEPFLIMALLEGDTLRSLLAQGSLFPSLVVALGIQLARGLARAHDLGIVHRDLKPENIFLVEDDGAFKAKLVDFGIARARTDSRLTAAGMLVGTPAYLAPERIHGQENDPSSDLYSLGVVLFEMITGRLPFLSESLPGFLFAHMETPPPSPVSINPACPRPLDSLILRLLAKEVQQRPVDAHQVVRELETIRFMVGAPPRLPRSIAPARPSMPSFTFERWSRRALLLEQMLQRAFPEGDAPPALVSTLDDLRDAVDALNRLKPERQARSRTLEDLGADARASREQLGHAVHELGVDLSTAREELQRLRAEADAREALVKDLEFQLASLREKLAEAEARTDARRHVAREGLAESGAQLQALKRVIGEKGKALADALRNHPANRELARELEQD
jgi:serine/threonine-protein kinase